jgi:hypothetical protein
MNYDQSLNHATTQLATADASLPDLLGHDIYGSRSAVHEGCTENEFKILPFQCIPGDAREFL